MDSHLKEFCEDKLEDFWSKIDVSLEILNNRFKNDYPVFPDILNLVTVKNENTEKNQRVQGKKQRVHLF